MSDDSDVADDGMRDEGHIDKVPIYRVVGTRD